MLGRANLYEIGGPQLVLLFRNQTINLKLAVLVFSQVDFQHYLLSTSSNTMMAIAALSPPILCETGGGAIKTGQEPNPEERKQY